MQSLRVAYGLSGLLLINLVLLAARAMLGLEQTF